MSVFTIRAHQRFAVCRPVHLRTDARRNFDGLLIELSRDGCRIGRAVRPGDLAIGDAVTLCLDGAAPIAARVRWLSDGAIGLRFAQPLHNAALESLIRLCRGEAENLPAYGT